MEMCRCWIDGVDERLQDWVGGHLRLGWAQCIGVIDSASLLADLCEEGRHEMLTEGGERVVRRLLHKPIKMIARKNVWQPEDCPANLTPADIMDLLLNNIVVLDGNQMLRLSDHVAMPA